MATAEVSNPLRDEHGHFIPRTPIVSGTSTPARSSYSKKEQNPMPIAISETSITSMALVSNPTKMKPTYLVARPSIPTKRMIREAFKTMEMEGRKSLSLAAIRKFIASRYLFTPNQINTRMRYVKKFLNEEIGSGKIIRTKGLGLTGSFRMSPKWQRKKQEKREKKLFTPVKGEAVQKKAKRGRPRKLDKKMKPKITARMARSVLLNY